MLPIFKVTDILPRKLPNLLETDNQTFYPWSCYVMFGYNFSGIKYFGPPLVQFGARDSRTKQFFSWSIWPVFFRERRRAWGSLIYISLTRCKGAITSTRNTPSIEASAKTASGNQRKWWKDRFLRNNSVEVFFVSFNSDMGLWLMFVVISGGGQTM